MSKLDDLEDSLKSKKNLREAFVKQINAIERNKQIAKRSVKTDIDMYDASIYRVEEEIVKLDILITALQQEINELQTKDIKLSNSLLF